MHDPHKKSASLVALIIVALCAASTAALSKDTAPTHLACDSFNKTSEAWMHCARAAATSDDELFYAGYWLAKTGRFEDALRFLQATKHKNERILTYIGFATRKLGHVNKALPYYSKALSINPDFTIARAYLGEAYLALDRPALADQELREIERRCGPSCKEYTELKTAIAEFVRRKI